MGLVRGSDPGVYMIFAQNDSWTDDETTIENETNDPRFYYPLIDFDFSIDRQRLERPDEIRPLGALDALEDGIDFVRGTMRLRPRYDAGFLTLMGYAIGGSETRFANQNAQGQAWTGSHAHEFRAGWDDSFAVQHGFFIRVHMHSEATGLVTETVQVFRGCFITRMVWEQAEGAPPIVTFEFLCRSTQLLAATSNDSATDPTAVKNDVPFEANDIRGAGKVKLGTDALNTFENFEGVVTSYTWTIDHKLEWAQSSLEALGQFNEKIAPNQNREITWEVEGLWDERDLAGSENHPRKAFVNNTHGGWDFLFNSATEIPGADPGVVYTARIKGIDGVFTDCAVNIEGPGVLRWSSTLVMLEAAWPDVFSRFAVGAADEGQADGDMPTNMFTRL